MPFLEACTCLICGSKFHWDGAKEAKAARLLCSADWERMRQWYKRFNRGGKFEFFFDDHVHAYITYLEGLRVRSESSSEKRD